MAKNTVFSKKNLLNINGNLVSLETPKVMGIINITPDSFYDGSRSMNLTNTLKRIEKMLEDGASFIDMGGYSSRPGADDVSIEDEIRRVVPVIEQAMKHFPEAIISVDTFRAEVAKQALDAGAQVINDISGGELDTAMFDLVGERNVPYIMMHMQGNPQNMVTKNNYEELIDDLLDYFQKKVRLLRKKGVSDLILDPGFGFAKNIAQNFELLGKLKAFDLLGCPLLVGVSRKSMIYKSLNISAENALNGTTVLHTMALLNGANLLRVHDVKEAMEAIKLVKLTFTKEEAIEY